MKVYIVQFGCYDEESIRGVYVSPEAAMEAHPMPDKDTNKIREGGWQKDDWGAWQNGYDWQDAGTITEYEVLGATQA